MVHVLKQCRREIAAFPEETRGDIADIAARLEEGHTLSMPLSHAFQKKSERTPGENIKVARRRLKEIL